MEKKFFVMLNTRGDAILPLVEEDGFPVLYATREQADDAGSGNLLGQTYGYEVFERS